MGFTKIAKRFERESHQFTPSTKEELVKYRKNAAAKDRDREERQKKRAPVKLKLVGKDRIKYREMFHRHDTFPILKSRVFEYFVETCKENDIKVPRYKEFLPRREAEYAFLYEINFALSHFTWMQLNRLLQEAVDFPVPTREHTEAFNLAAHALITLGLGFIEDRKGSRLADRAILDAWPAASRKRPSKEDRMSMTKQEDDLAKRGELKAKAGDDEEDKDIIEGADDEDDEEEEKEPAKSKNKKSTANKDTREDEEEEDEEEEDEEDEEEEDEEEDEDEEEEDEEEDEEVEDEPAELKRQAKRTRGKAVEDEDDDDEGDEEADEEEEEKPKKKVPARRPRKAAQEKEEDDDKPARRKSSAKKTSKDDDEEEEDDGDEEQEKPKQRRKPPTRRAVKVEDEDDESDDDDNDDDDEPTKETNVKKTISKKLAQEKEELKRSRRLDKKAERDAKKARLARKSRRDEDEEDERPAKKTKKAVKEVKKVRTEKVDRGEINIRPSTRLFKVRDREKDGPKTVVLDLMGKKGMTLADLEKAAEKKGINPKRVKKFVTVMARYGLVRTEK